MLTFEIKPKINSMYCIWNAYIEGLLYMLLKIIQNGIEVSVSSL